MSNPKPIDRLIPTIADLEDYTGKSRKTLKRWGIPLIPTGVTTKGNYQSVIDTWLRDFREKIAAA